MSLPARTASLLKITLAFVWAFWMNGSTLTLADSVIINGESDTYDSHMSATRSPAGDYWFAWHGYRNGQDQILARQLNPQGVAVQQIVLSDGGTVHGPPKIAALTDGSVSVVWSLKREGRWQIVLRRFDGTRWLPAVTLSSIEHDAIFPTIAETEDGELAAAWCEHVNDHWQVMCCRIVHGKPSTALPVSTGDQDAARPVLAHHAGQTWIFWDQYDRPNYSIYGRVAFPETGKIERVSPADEYCLAPAVLSHTSGLHVSWLRKIDVMGGPGVISQWHTLHAAVRRQTGWFPIRTADGSTVAAELTQGLMAKIEPRAIATGGYLGPRTRPTFLADSERVWLLWERKSNHRGSTPTVSGDLVGRPSLNGHWQTPVVLKQKFVDYNIVDQTDHRSGATKLLASQLPRHGQRTYQMLDLNLSQTTSFQQDEWTGWKPVELPIELETSLPPRTISADGKSYRLFWADLHCHNGLTADAEGQPDEMHHYARDRAKLDVVVFTNNDFYNVPLTQYDFELGNLFASKFSTRPDADQRGFLSLPGFEWTSRIPGTVNASLDDPGNWMPPYQNRSYPNHRSVIYPPGGGPLVHFTEVGNDIDQLNEAVQAAGGITLSQHNAFKLSGHSVEVGMELTSGWSNYMDSHPKLFHEPLNRGVRLGFTANGDTHRRAPGLSGALTGIYAEELTAESILDALRQRRCYATMGSRIFVDARANGHLMGDASFAQDRRASLTLAAAGTRPITQVSLIRNGEVIHEVSGDDSRTIRASFTDENLPEGTHWYYWRIRQSQPARVLPGNLMPAHGHLAWSSPNWVTVKR